VGSTPTSGTGLFSAFFAIFEGSPHTGAHAKNRGKSVAVVVLRWSCVDVLQVGPSVNYFYGESTMAWNELDPSGYYSVCFRFGKQRFKRSLKTKDKHEADRLTSGLERTIQDVERGRLAIPENADVVTFLLSDGRVTDRPKISDRLTLAAVFDAYFASIPNGSMEVSTLEGMKIHRKHLEKHFKASFPIKTLASAHLERYVAARPVSGATIQKEVVTLRTVWNWALRSKLVEGPFPGRDLKYPKTDEKPPFISFEEAKSKNDEKLWDSVYLTVEDIDLLLKHVQAAKHPFVYPMFVFAAHTGMRRSEIMRTRVSDLDMKNGWITVHELKRSHKKKTTRRVPISAPLQTALIEWLAVHPGGQALFCHGGHVARSKTRSRMTGYAGKNRPTTHKERMATIKERSLPPVGSLTKDEMHNHFKSALANSQWSKLKGWHVFRHSFISALAAKGVDQRIIDDFVGHCTEEQRRRYRHLIPSTTKQAFTSVFG
jgi:integrase